MAEWWTNTSLPPSTSINPKPFLSLNHFTFPVIRTSTNCHGIENTNGQYCLSVSALLCINLPKKAKSYCLVKKQRFSPPAKQIARYAPSNEGQKSTKASAARVISPFGDTKRVLDSRPRAHAVFIRNVLQAVYGSRVIDCSHQYLLRGFPACLKIAIRAKISASQKLFHGIPPSAPNNYSTQGNSRFSNLKLIIPPPEDKRMKGAEGDCQNFHLLNDCCDGKNTSMANCNTLILGQFLCPAPFIPLCTSNYIDTSFLTNNL
jgi:hypothetical protein